MCSQDNQDNAPDKPEDNSQPPIIRPEEKAKEVVDCNTNACHKYGESNENPIYVKESKTSKRLKRSEIFTLFSIALTFGALVAAIYNAKQAVTTVTDNQKRFEKGNQPYLQINDLSLKKYWVGSRFGFGYRIDNISNYAVKITKRRFKIFPYAAIPDRSVFDIPDHDIDTGTETGEYLSKSNTDTTYFWYEKPLDQIDSIVLADKKMFIYFVGIVNYKNLITDSIGAYKFMIEYCPPEHAYRYIYNDNYP